MKASSRKRRSRSKRRWPQQMGQGRTQTALWKPMLLCILLHAMGGAILAAWAVELWVWLLAIAAILTQIIALAGPQTLQRFRWLSANLLVLLSALGAGGYAVALSIALNQIGSADLGQLGFGKIAADVVLFSLLAVGLTGLISSLTAAVGDRLMRHLSRSQVIVRLSLACLLGLGLGALAGYLI